MRKTTIAMAVFVSAAAVCEAGYFWVDYRRDERAARQDLLATTRVVAEYVSNVFTVIDLTLRVLDEDPNTDDVLISGKAHNAHETLRRAQSASPAIKGLGLIGTDGHVVASAEHAQPSVIDLSDRPYFRHHRDNQDSGLLVSAPVVSRPDNSVAIPVSRRVVDMMGNFAGVIAARIDPDYFLPIFEKANIVNLTIARRDGTLIARLPKVDLMQAGPLRKSWLALAKAAERNEGVVDDVSPIDDLWHIYAFRKIDRGDLVVMAATDKEKIFNNWLAQRGLSIAISTALILGACGVVCALLIQRRHAREILDAKEEAHRSALRAAAEADRANKSKSEFLSRMSHELRTPLNAVIGFAQMMEIDQQSPLRGKQREYCENIKHAGSHLLALISEVLDLVQIESGHMKLAIGPVNLAKAVDGVAGAMAPIAAKAGINLTFDPLKGIPFARADETRLREILMNLVSNAIKYNHPGGDVRISAEVVEDERVRITVSDTGRGIDPAKKDALFKPFERLGAEFSAIGGTGIGLTISRQIAEAMRGSLDYSSLHGHGSKFWVELPIDQAVRHDPPRPTLATDLEAAELAAGSYSVLYIEDNLANLRLMEHLISTLPGATMFSAMEPTQGLDLAYAHRPDVILLDLNLPDISGYEVMGRLRADDRTRDIPVIALTAAAMPTEIRRGVEAGFFRYLTKPIEVKACFAAIGDALAQRRATRNSEPARSAG